jgi:hypothetical protein
LSASTVRCAALALGAALAGCAREAGPPGARPDPAAPAQATADSTPSRVYAHLSGLRATLPDGWKAHEASGQTAFRAPDAGQEAWVLLVMPAPPGADLERIAREILDGLRTDAPGLAPDGNVAWTGTGGARSGRVRFTGASQGATVAGDLRFRVEDDRILGLFGLGPAPGIAAQAAQAGDLFQSFRLEPPKLDERLVRRWSRSEAHAEAAGNSSMATEVALELGSDGSCRRTARPAGAAAGAATSEDAESGWWSAEDGRLRVVFPGRSQEWSYSLADGTLATVDGEGQRLLWR